MVASSRRWPKPDDRKDRNNRENRQGQGSHAQNWRWHQSLSNQEEYTLKSTLMKYQYSRKRTLWTKCQTLITWSSPHWEKLTNMMTFVFGRHASWEYLGKRWFPFICADTKCRHISHIYLIICTYAHTHTHRLFKIWWRKSIVRLHFWHWNFCCHYQNFCQNLRWVFPLLFFHSTICASLDPNYQWLISCNNVAVC